MRHPEPTPSRTSRSAGSRSRSRRTPGVPVVAPVAARAGRPRAAAAGPPAGRPTRADRPSPRTGRPCGDRAAGRQPGDLVGQRGLAGAGRPVDADQPAAPSVAGRARTRSRTPRRRLPSERQAQSAVGRHRRRRTALPGSRCTPTWRARTARRTWRAGTTPGRRSPAAPAAGPVSGVCTSPAPSRPVRWSPAGAHGIGSRSAPAGPEATRPPPCDGRDPGRGPADTGRPKNAAGAARRSGSGRRAPGTSSPDPAATSVTTGSACGRLDRAGAAGVPELQVGELRERSRRSRGGAPRAGSATAALSRRTTSDRARRSRHGVRHAGDLALVGHHADQAEAGPVAGWSGPGRPRRRCRAAGSAWARRAGRRSESPASTSIATRTGTAGGRGPSRRRRGGPGRRPSG